MARKFIVGIDEVGRGCLAGPLTVAAVLMRRAVNFRGIRDSKKLSAKQRKVWESKIKAYGLRHKALGFAIASVGSQIIDRIGISASARLAVSRCLRKLTTNYQLSTINYKILLDGSLYAPRTYLNQKTIIKGDEKIPLIAAASIVAKVYRDRKMTRLHKLFPQYGLAVHKGYGTKLHRQAIKKHGLSSIHRLSFCHNFV
ncbi:hypothetical protein A3G55_00070 [Candidatus Giovannonibacteria bacterium RIFCSPLOWO2_12_FULL_44_25]|uniref:Ribonuclease HII n=3 Tax=Candidatus Giovannoniibacteriota TaxID=1752738 RepID=A0A0G1LBL7_9BACT|nr:MAG: Ribonuclease HII [Parcubacteria group bacterium GW2011_GWC1_44_10]KKT57324.1 MAG: Ribonuclease HII [Candidatus Giovannonibacteria bacterium GW2011_GWB1_44_23]KKT59672.1 MAG: Ribonuclease HII [Candidatus Giovannonibacteria bacterium GW2011_GWA1_44_25]OGF50049.1 MAG: hypothetical protein A2120_02880 [Candidatus Giovannonibacteria bacterium GWA2_45_15]OGF59116.1 MAG: hypothetical protein A2W40_01145 [Candidatus Giovannonibacteria bacterium RIFCSPHIGHO2_01_45_12]OGF60672.1 MAG: hypothetica